MWPRLRDSKIQKVGKNLREVGKKSCNVNEEYLNALRTKSYADFFNKANQLLVRQHSSSSPSFCDQHKFSKTLLEPGQESIPSILESGIFSNIPELKILMLRYFDISAEASNICSHLLKSINKIQSNYKFIQKSLDGIEEYYNSPENIKLIISNLNLFTFQTNPLSNLINKHDFKLIHDKYSLVLNHLKLMRKKVTKKMKIIKYFRKASRICITIACNVVAIAAILLAAHTLTALIMGPTIFNFPLKCLKKKLSKFPFLRCGFLKKVGDQLDIAAKGTYILKRDFDTMSRLVTRLHDEVEHNKEMIQFCFEKRDQDKFSLQVVKELKRSDSRFRKQVEDLEEHVCLCLVTINRARRLVIKEITTSCKKGLRG